MKDSRFRPLFEVPRFDLEYITTQDLKDGVESVPVSNRASLLTLRALTDEVIFSEGISDNFGASSSELEEEMEYLLIDGPFDDE
ncbi:hypothetical protein KC614_01615 [candidate division WWE3 bacterium]|uniref:Uncharacterized protein n=1 Tax=candidate division WWE3 bacterium TaxID=2053526 RepID=A0A955RQQ4_UNCKA|nr:hypothetical protein [candidate division WWE3 bacterium]